MNIYEAFNWIKAAEYTAHGYVIFNQDSPEGKLKGEALKTIFEAAKNGELVPVELFNQVKKERDNLEKLKQEPILDNIKAEIGKSKTEHEMQIAEGDIKAKLLISHIYCDIVNILDKYKAESEEINGR